MSYKKLFSFKTRKQKFSSTQRKKMLRNRWGEEEIIQETEEAILLLLKPHIVSQNNEKTNKND